MQKRTVDSALRGTLSAQSLGPPLFTLALGLLDGFDPCAMWVPLLLPAILVRLNDRRRMALIAGTFVLVGGAVNDAFMAAWLNVFLAVGPSHTARLLFAGVAPPIGAFKVMDFFALRRGFSFGIPEGVKPGLVARMRGEKQSQALAASMPGVAALAVVVKLVDLLCTAAHPAICTAVLARQKLDTAAHLACLGRYIVGHVTDDALMVTLAVLALSSDKLTERAGRGLKLLSPERLMCALAGQHPQPRIAGQIDPPTLPSALAAPRSLRLLPADGFTPLRHHGPLDRSRSGDEFLPLCGQRHRRRADPPRRLGLEQRRRTGARTHRRDRLAVQKRLADRGGRRRVDGSARRWHPRHRPAATLQRVGQQAAAPARGAPARSQFRRRWPVQGRARHGRAARARRRRRHRSAATAFTAVATDLESSSEVWLREGSLFDAIRASMAAPMVFTPLRLNGRLLADGGLVNPLPMSALPQREGLLTIAVDLGGQPLAEPRRQGERGLIDVAVLSMQAVQDTVTRLRLAERAPDVRVCIPRDACGFHEFWRAQELIALGRERVAEAIAALPQQRQLA